MLPLPVCGSRCRQGTVFMALKKHLFIVFEGIDGSGKSTACVETEKVLSARGIPCVRSAEPTQGVYGQKIRSLLSHPIKPDPDMMLELFVKDREEDVLCNITPNRARGSVVLLDRYYYSNAAYQGASGISYKRILRVNGRYGFPEPDRVYLFDIDPNEALTRINARNSGKGVANDSFEKVSFLEEVRSLYLKMADERFVLIDASKKPDEILDLIISDLFRNFSDVE